MGTFDRVVRGLRSWFGTIADCCDPDVLLCDCGIATGDAGEICADCA